MLALVCVSAGCSLLHGSRHDTQGSVPPSHTVAVERALDNAFSNLSLPPGNGRRMHWTPDGQDVLSLLPPHGAEYLISRGYKLTAVDSTTLRCVITVDTLFVNLGSKDDSGRIERVAGAQLSAEIKSTNGDRQVFQAKGAYEDMVEERFIGILDGENPLLQRSRGIVYYLKPILYGLTVTAMVWFLYSYRG